MGVGKSEDLVSYLGMSVGHGVVPETRDELGAGEGPILG